jgi:hypothetical protein
MAVNVKNFNRKGPMCGKIRWKEPKAVKSDGRSQKL